MVDGLHHVVQYHTYGMIESFLKKRVARRFGCVTVLEGVV